MGEHLGQGGKQGHGTHELRKEKVGKGLIRNEK
jgi:hypothetical protein